jgi:hypothetical protein
VVFSVSPARSNPVPTSAATGIAVIANRNAFHVKCVSGQTNVGAPWVTGHTVTVAMHDVATATNTANGRHVRNMMPSANSTPAAGTL